MELLSSPGRELSALLVRVVQHPTGLSYYEDESVSWMQVGAKAGWIALGDRKIRMKIVRDRGATEVLRQDGMPSEIPE